MTKYKKQELLDRLISLIDYEISKGNSVFFEYGVWKMTIEESDEEDKPYKTIEW